MGNGVELGIRTETFILPVFCLDPLLIDRPNDVFSLIHTYSQTPSQTKRHTRGVFIDNHNAKMGDVLL